MRVGIYYWINESGNTEGYSVMGYYNEKELFSGTMEQCKQFIRNNGYIEMEV